MKVERQILHNCLAQAKSFYKLGDNEQARDWCDRGIVFVANKKMNGFGGEDIIEGVKVDLWLERFWMYLENKNLLL